MITLSAFSRPSISALSRSVTPLQTEILTIAMENVDKRTFVFEIIQYFLTGISSLNKLTQYTHEYTNTQTFI